MILSAAYNALWYPALPFALIAAGGARADRRERLARQAVVIDGMSRPSAPRIWLHASSVGEVEAIRPLARGLAREYPDAALIVTTMTVAGRDAARRRIERVAPTLAPLDCAPLVRRFLAANRPTLVLIAETELWPNYFLESHRAGARVALVNARLSQRSLSRYILARGLFTRALGAADLVMAQSGDDARRFEALGARPDRIVVTGNTKFDFELDAAPSLRPELEGFAGNAPILVAGATAPGEERVILAAYQSLRERFTDLALVIAPRHLDRVREVRDTLDSAALEYTMASAPGAQSATARAMVLDTMGELRAFYRRAAIAFIGGSLFAGRGGQNPAEAALSSVPVMFGPHHENQRAIAEALIAAGGAFVVNDAPEIAAVCATLLGDKSRRIRAGNNARAAVAAMAGAVEATLMRIGTLISLR